MRSAIGLFAGPIPITTPRSPCSEQVVDIRGFGVGCQPLSVTFEKAGCLLVLCCWLCAALCVLFVPHLLPEALDGLLCSYKVPNSAHARYRRGTPPVPRGVL